MRNYEILTVSDGEQQFDVKVSAKEKTIWFSLRDLCDFYRRDRSVITKRIKDIVLSDADTASMVSKGPNAGNSRPVTLYNLDMALLLGERLKSKRAVKLKEFLDDYLLSRRIKPADSCLKYSDGNVALEVSVSPEEETVWLNVIQIAELYGVPEETVSHHIKSILVSGELDPSSVIQFSLRPTAKGTPYGTAYYNLDMILSIGYRVQSSRAASFRKWASDVLRDYLIGGYALNRKRLASTPMAMEELERKVFALTERLDASEKRLTKIEGGLLPKVPKQAIFYGGEFFDGRMFFLELIQRAKRSIIVVDPFCATHVLSLLAHKDPQASIALVTGTNHMPGKHELSAFEKQYGPVAIKHTDEFHDRFLFIDDEAYHMGASFNGIGKKTFAVMKIEAKDDVAKLRQRIDSLP